MENGFNLTVFRAALIRNLATVGEIAFGSMAAVMILSAVIGMIGVMRGELALMHVLAMLGMAAGFGILTSLCMALIDGFGLKTHENGDNSYE